MGGECQFHHCNAINWRRGEKLEIILGNLGNYISDLGLQLLYYNIFEKQQQITLFGQTDKMYTSIKTIVALLAIGAISATNASCAHLTTLHPRSFKEASFSYEAPTGPDVWHTLDAKNEMCAAGTHQSPIDIHMLDLNTDLSASGVRSIPGSDLKVQIPDVKEGAEFENLGTTIEVVVNGTLSLAGVDRKLAQFHFHTPGEHLIDGKAAEMEAHFVFQSDTGAIAVVGFMLNTDAATESGLFSTVMESVDEIATPGSVVQTQALSFGKLVEHLNANDVLTYSGSLTTPPCSEGVSWLISSAPLSISASDVAAAQKLMGHNARPVQGDLGGAPEEQKSAPAQSTVYETVYACPSSTQVPSALVTSPVPALVSSLAGAVPTGVLPSGFKNSTMTTMGSN